MKKYFLLALFSTLVLASPLLAAPPVVVISSPNVVAQMGCHGDGDVDGQDYLIWQRTFGSTPDNSGWYAPADINKNGVVDAADYSVWRDHFGTNCGTPGCDVADIDYPSFRFRVSASVNDDGLPNPPGAISSTWTVVFGDGSAVFFDTPHSTSTFVTFTKPGAYALMLAVTDGVDVSTGVVQVQINPRPGSVVTVGPDQTILFSSDQGDGDVDGHDFLLWQRHFGTTPGDALWYAPADINKNGVVDAADYTIWRDTYGSTTTFVADIDYRTITTVGGTSTGSPTTWRKVSGPGLVSFADSAALTTDVAFSAPGVYMIEMVTYNDCNVPVVDRMIINVVAPGVPVVDAGPDVDAPINTEVQMNATVSVSTAFPVSLTYKWTVVSGPASAPFTDPAILNPKITFMQPGVYVLDLEVFDGTNFVHDQVTINATTGPSQSGPIGDTPNIITPGNRLINFPINVHQSGNVTVKVYDHTGDLIKTLFDGFVAVGATQNVTWDGSNLNNSGVGSGVYVVYFELPGQNIKKKVIVSR